MAERTRPPTLPPRVSVEAQSGPSTPTQQDTSSTGEGGGFSSPVMRPAITPDVDLRRWLSGGGAPASDAGSAHNRTAQSSARGGSIPVAATPASVGSDAGAQGGVDFLVHVVSHKDCFMSVEPPKGYSSSDPPFVKPSFSKVHPIAELILKVIDSMPSHQVKVLTHPLVNYPGKSSDADEPHRGCPEAPVGLAFSALWCVGFVCFVCCCCCCRYVGVCLSCRCCAAES